MNILNVDNCGAIFKYNGVWYLLLDSSRDKVFAVDLTNCSFVTISYDEYTELEEGGFIKAILWESAYGN